ncbi:unnamed protein product [Aureobasidium vineae]|uniref:Knr4/Smi1-like domain-containing protein n=1 Tax=Aureobasidium vineae TaxID=2773715 RepID=A0A9N8J825_9PEZI|nr:unnamed protein product [Aureobasidium vineae]
MASPPDPLVKPAYILSIPHLEAVENCILGIALRLILLGRVDAARDFVELFYSRPALQNLEFAGMRAMVPYWRKTHFPAGFPEKMKTDAYINEYLNLKDREGLQWPHYVLQDQRTEDEAGITAIMSPENDHPSSYRTQAPIVALDLAVKLAEERGFDPSADAKVHEILVSLLERISNKWEDCYLVDSPRCVPVFMSGALAKIWGLSAQELDSRAAKLLEASRQRYWHGPSPQGPDSMSELLQSCNDDSVAKSDSFCDEMDQEQPTSLYKAPATEQQISDLEQRLNITLPDDFKTFLRSSNGFGGIWNGYFPGPPLRSTDEIDWLDYSEYELVFDQLSHPWLANYQKDLPTHGEEFPEPPIFTNVICVASEDIDDVWLIPPQMMQQMREHYKKVYEMLNDDGKRIIERSIDDFAGSWDEWETLDWGCVYWACGGSATLICFKSFKAWLEDQAWDVKDRE